MSRTQPQQNSKPDAQQIEPWYRQFWPWFIIALPASAVIASFFTLWLAISNPVQMVVTEQDYQQLRSELKAQTVDQNNKEADSSESDPKLN
jgi:hypothetical protein